MARVFILVGPAHGQGEGTPMCLQCSWEVRYLQCSSEVRYLQCSWEV
jgi:hypothetical protein